jgi:protoporphyrinogen/coproporphyrinogen III oxidase
VAVLGGGISGLSAAYFLSQTRRQGAPIETTLFEAGTRLGGIIRTEEVGGFIVEGGPDSFLAEKPEAAALCRELSLGDSLIGSNDRHRRIYILHSSAFRPNRLVPLPEGLVLFVPTQLRGIISTPLLPFPDKLSIVLNRFRQHDAPGVRTTGESSSGDQGRELCDESVAAFVARHFGKAMLENIADPLLAGIFGGDTAKLSMRSALPHFCQMEHETGNLTRAIVASRAKRERDSENAPIPLFLSLKQGMEALVRALISHLDDVSLLTGKRIVRIEPIQNGNGDGPSGSRGSRAKHCRYRICYADGGFHDADAVIIALPAHESSRLVNTLDASLSRELAGISYSSALTVALGYRPGVCAALPKGFGFLVPRSQNRHLLACTFVHQKFDHRAPAGHALIRCFLGGARDPDVLHLSDDEVLAIVNRELEQILGLSSKPEFFRVFRWPAAMPQYEVGHAARLDRIQTRLKELPGLLLAGNIYTGVGISDCIRSARSAAEKAVTMLRAL